MLLNEIGIAMKQTFSVMKIQMSRRMVTAVLLGFLNFVDYGLKERTRSVHQSCVQICFNALDIP